MASGHSFSCGSSGIVRPKITDNLGDSEIQRPYLKNDQSPNQPNQLCYVQQHNHNSNESCTVGHMGHQFCRVSITDETEKPENFAPTHMPKRISTKNSKSSPTINHRLSLITIDMYGTDTNHTGKTLAEHLQLSSYEINLLQQSWQRLRCSPNLFINIFRNLISQNTTAKELFRKTSIIDGFTSYKCYDVKEHANSLTELINFALQEIRGFTKVVQDRCMLLGAAHCNACENSMSSSSWDQFGDLLAESIVKSETVRAKRKCLKAWNVLLSFMVDRIKCGYLAECKRRASKKSSRQENVGPS